MQAERLGKTVQHRGHAVEGVVELAARRRFGQAEAGQVGGDDAVAAGELRDEVAEHVAGGGIAVQQQAHGRVRWAGLTKKDFDGSDSLGLVGRGHGDVIHSVANPVVERVSILC